MFCLMVTYFLSLEDVRAYLRDFLARLQTFDPNPTIWCPITRSGTALLDQILDLVKADYPGMVERVSVVPIGVCEKTNALILGSDDPAKDIVGKPVLLFDGAVHRGALMSRCVTEVLKLGASHVGTYSLVVKRGSNFIPTLWGVMIEDTDRVFFLLKQIPNNRLDAGSAKTGETTRRTSCLHIRRLCGEHVDKSPVECGVASLDRVTWGDRHFDMLAGEHLQCTYVLHAGNEVVSYLTVYYSDEHCLVITEIAVDKKHHGKKFGGILLRFADTLARQSNCWVVRLNAIKEKITFYEGFGYKLVAGREPIRLDDEEYWLMERQVIYHQFLPH